MEFSQQHPCHQIELGGKGKVGGKPRETCGCVCSADAALRRAIPAFNADVRDIQTKLEDVAFKLRIPQRKPWVAMADDVSAAQAMIVQPDKVITGSFL